MSVKTKCLTASALIFVSIFILQYNTEWVADDFILCTHIPTVSSIFHRALHYYLSWDGRFASFLLNHSFLYIPHLAASFILTCVVLGTVFFISAVSLGEQWKSRLSWKHLLFVFMALWISSPAPGEAYFWRTGACYGTTGLLLLLSLSPYFCLAKNKLSPLVILAVLPFGIMVGLGDYAAPLALAFLVFCMAVHNRSEYDKYTRVCMAAFIAVLLCCFCIAYFSPGNALRLSQLPAKMQDAGLMDKIVIHLKNQGKIQSLYLLQYGIMLYCACIIFIGKKKRPALTFSRKALLYPALFFLAGQACQAAFMFAPWAAGRAYTFSSLFMLLAACSLLFSIPKDYFLCSRPVVRLSRLAVGALVALWSLSYFDTQVMFYANREHLRSVEQLVRAAGPDAEVCVPIGPFRSNPYAFSGLTLQVGDDQTHWLNTYFAEAHQIASIRLCPQDVEISYGSPQDAVYFKGRAQDTSLAFSYAPLPELAGQPYVLFFKKHPRSFLRSSLESMLIPSFASYWPAQQYMKNNYIKIVPELTKQGALEKGSAAVPHLEYAGEGFIAYPSAKGDFSHIFRLKLERR